MPSSCYQSARTRPRADICMYNQMLLTAFVSNRIPGRGSALVRFALLHANRFPVFDRRVRQWFTLAVDAPATDAIQALDRGVGSVLPAAGHEFHPVRRAGPVLEGVRSGREADVCRKFQIFVSEIMIEEKSRS